MGDEESSRARVVAHRFPAKRGVSPSGPTNMSVLHEPKQRAGVLQRCLSSREHLPPSGFCLCRSAATSFWSGAIRLCRPTYGSRSAA